MTRKSNDIEGQARYPRIVIATRNVKKLHELQRYLKAVKAEVLSLAGFDRPPAVREDRDTFRENAVKKAVRISKFVKGMALADDSGLVVDALGGDPGVRSARFAGPGKRDVDNNKKVLKLLEGVPPKKRTARFVCAVAIADNGQVVKVIEENCKGLIASGMKGARGFGYDSVFLIPIYNKTFGQLGLKVKDRMSHRSKALKKVRAFLRKYI